MEIKVQCRCGQRYAFDVEPVDGRMPIEIFCPACGVEGTELANQQICEKLVPASGGNTPEPAKLRLSRPAPSEAQAAPLPPPPPLRQSTTSASSAVPPKKEQVRVFGEPNPWKGLAGAVIGAVIACAIWYGLWKGTGVKWGIMAIAVGWFAGFGARWMGRTEGQMMGLMTAGVALAFIIGFQAMRASDEMGQWRLSDADREQAVQESVADAKKTVAAIPNATDEEIRLYLAKQAVTDNEAPNLDAVSNQDVKDFRDTELKQARDIVEGRRSKEQMIAELKKNEDDVHNSVVMSVIFWIKAVGIFNIISIVVGVGSAYKFGNGEG